MKRLISVAIILSLASFAAGPALAYPGPTKIVNYSAAGMKGNAVKGSCWTSSTASTRSDAYRCMIGNSIMDPCFKLSAKAVACPENVAANTGVIINLTKPLPAPNPKSVAKPWRFQVAGGSGIICNAGTGTVIGNYPYYCSGNLVCSVPAVNAKWPTTFMAQCGTPSGPMSVKGARAMSVTTLWQ
ncbi:MAG TPA: hypothetical protein VFW34_05045 [Candidatus Rubrimentiphilum sp.]|nr:hypothetical protein [Candidatus Rubrimentiphilum sp.]